MLRIMTRATRRFGSAFSRWRLRRDLGEDSRLERLRPGRGSPELSPRGHNPQAFLSRAAAVPTLLQDNLVQAFAILWCRELVSFVHREPHVGLPCPLAVGAMESLHVGVLQRLLCTKALVRSKRQESLEEVQGFWGGVWRQEGVQRLLWPAGSRLSSPLWTQDSAESKHCSLSQGPGAPPWKAMGWSSGSAPAGGK